MTWTSPRTDPDLAAVEAWRLLLLLRAGYTFHRAEQLALNPDVDVRLAVKLLRSGCDQKLALRILL